MTTALETFNAKLAAHKTETIAQMYEMVLTRKTPRTADEAYICGRLGDELETRLGSEWLDEFLDYVDTIRAA